MTSLPLKQPTYSTPTISPRDIITSGWNLLRGGILSNPATSTDDYSVLPANKTDTQVSNILIDKSSLDELLGYDYGYLQEELADLFQAASYEDLENGIDSDFVDGLIFYVENYNIDAVTIFRELILTDKSDEQVSGEALRWLGRIDDELSSQERLGLLQDGLKHRSRWIRDGAALGIVAMKDKSAIPALCEAIAVERVSDLREDMEAALSRLEQS